MNFSIHIDEATARRLRKEAARRRQTRNAVITQAVKQWLERAQHTEWPADLLQFEGVPQLEPSESLRSKKKVRARFP